MSAAAPRPAARVSAAAQQRPTRRQVTDGKPFRTYLTNESFGELALLYNAPRAATVKCAESGTLWVLDRKAFRHVMVRTGYKELIDKRRRECRRRSAPARRGPCARPLRARVSRPRARPTAPACLGDGSAARGAC